MYNICVGKKHIKLSARAAGKSGAAKTEAFMEQVGQMIMSAWLQDFVDWFNAFWADNGRTVITFACVLILGFIAIKIILSVVNRLLKRSKRGINTTAAHFLVGLLKVFLYLIWLIAMLTLLGIPTTSLIALFSAFALALSLALQSVISNLASGVVLVFTKPFVEGDFITIAGGQTGTVDRINMFNTRLITVDNEVVVVPNNAVVTAGVTNFTANETRRVVVPLSVAYGTDTEKVREVALAVARSQPLVLADPEPVVIVDAHNASSVDLQLRVWTKKENYWPVAFYLKEQMLPAFKAAGIEIPFNQMDIHIKDESAALIAATAEEKSAGSTRGRKRAAEKTTAAESKKAEDKKSAASARGRKKKN